MTCLTTATFLLLLYFYCCSLISQRVQRADVVTIGYSKTAKIGLVGAHPDAQIANYEPDPPHHNTSHSLEETSDHYKEFSRIYQGHS